MGWKCRKYEKSLYEISVYDIYSAGGSTVTEGQKDTTSACSNLRFQSSLIDVYARFLLSNEHDTTVYLLHQKAKFIVTDIVRPLLQVTDETVAHLRDRRVIDAVEPGQTSVQVTRLSWLFHCLVTAYLLAGFCHTEVSLFGFIFLHVDLVLILVTDNCYSALICLPFRLYVLFITIQVLYFSVDGICSVQMLGIIVSIDNLLCVV